MNILARLWLTLGLAATYFAFGKLGLALALPPGYVSALWPAAGIAFAAALAWGPGRAWPGIFLGSLLTNASMGGGLNFNFNTVAAGIAVGSALQSVVGAAWLLRRDAALALNRPDKVIAFSLIGVASCLIAATLGNFTLWAHGIISLAQVPQSFVTWWLGDAFGVQIFAPIGLLVVARDAIWKRRRLAVGLPLLLSFLLCGLVYYFVRNAEEDQLKRNLAAATAPLLNELSSVNLTHGHALTLVASAYRQHEKPPGADFVTLAAEVYTRLPAFRAIEWVALLDAQQKRDFLRVAQQSGSSARGVRYPQGFTPTSDGQVAPVMFVYPLDGNENALGLDMLGEPVRAAAVRSALENDRLAASSPIHLAQDPQGPGALLLVAPAQGVGWRGAVLGVLDLRILTERLTAALPQAVWELHELTPGAAQPGAKLAGTTKQPLPRFSGATHLDRNGVYVQQETTIGDRHWRIVLHMPHSALVGSTGNTALLVLFLAFAACAIFANFAFIASGDRERIADEVAVKTRGLNDEINERKRTELALEQAKNAAEAANIAKSQFLATMSHEIRTPMNGILGMAQLLMMEGVDETERMEYVRTILNSGQALMTILNDILDLSKVEAGKLELQITPFEPTALVEETATLFREGAASKGLVVAVDSDLARMRVLGDPLRLRQMLTNLMGNALKFSERGTITLAVREQPDASLPAQRQRLVFSVRDQGIGIPADKLGLLFQPFVQVDGSATRRFGGTGLGLSIVRRLAQLMQGDVSVVSREGDGACFEFTAVVERVEGLADTRRGVRGGRDERGMGGVGAAASAEVAGTPGSESVSVGTEAGARWVLVAEDIATNRMVVTSMLTKLGLEARCAENGAEALRLLMEEQENPPAVILMDCQMPVLDGYGATEAIREFEVEYGRPRHSIIALTADAFAEDRERCTQAGMDDFLAKPLVYDELVAALRRAGLSV